MGQGGGALWNGIKTAANVATTALMPEAEPIMGALTGALSGQSGMGGDGAQPSSIAPATGGGGPSNVFGKMLNSTTGALGDSTTEQGIVDPVKSQINGGIDAGFNRAQNYAQNLRKQVQGQAMSRIGGSTALHQIARHGVDKLSNVSAGLIKTATTGGKRYAQSKVESWLNPTNTGYIGPEM